LKNFFASRNIFFFFFTVGNHPFGSNHIIYCILVDTSNEGRNRWGRSVFSLSSTCSFNRSLLFRSITIRSVRFSSVLLLLLETRVFFIEVLPPIIRICHVEYVQQASSQLRLIINAHVYGITGSAEMVAAS
jgi:hypothetical protein